MSKQRLELAVGHQNCLVVLQTEEAHVRGSTHAVDTGLHTQLAWARSKFSLKAVCEDSVIDLHSRHER